MGKETNSSLAVYVCQIMARGWVGLGALLLSGYDLYF